MGSTSYSTARQRVSTQRDTNQIIVDISNQLSALRQSRAKYAAAKQTRVLQEELLASETQEILLWHLHVQRHYYR